MLLIAYIVQIFAILLTPFYRLDPLVRPRIHALTPQLTPISVSCMLYSQSFKGVKARALLDYTPVVTYADAMRRTMAFFTPKSKSA